jgi:4-oxalocrotonate tautomerase
MPVVSVRLARGRGTEANRALPRAVTQAVSESLDLPAAWVTVLIEEYDRENWASGGELHADRFGPGCGRKPLPGCG